MSAPDGYAQDVLGGAVEALQAIGGALYEQLDAGEPFAQTAVLSCDADPEVSFPPDSFLARWLRVNRLALPIPDAINVCSRLTTRETTGLARVGATLVAPLMAGPRMAGWVAVRTSRARAARPSAPPGELSTLASRLLHDRQRARDLARGELVARSNRLALAGQMAAGVAHEVRNPLAAVRSIVQMVQDEVDAGTEHARLLDTVLSEVDRVNQVLTGMLSLGRPTAGRTELIDLTTLVGDAITFCGAYARAKGQRVSHEWSAPLMVVGDPHELRQVFVNILLNACQASRDGQTIHVDAARRNGADRAVAAVRVVDEGAGIPADLLAKVFEPFFTTKVNGGGLGLSLCREAMQRHGGDIVISSKAGEGTQVLLTFPLAERDT